jgi:aldose 1-epimerase
MTETLQNDFWRLTIEPRLGASPVALEFRVNDAWEPVMRPTAPELLSGDSSSPFSSYTLAPYSNRIRDGRFVFQGKEYTLRPNNAKGETIHGDIRNRAFKVTRNTSSLVCHLDSTDFSDANFPFPYTVTVTYALEDARFVTRIELKNVGESAMPAGFGFHPYFVRRFNQSVSDPTIQFTATGYYVTDEKTIPVTGAEPLTEHLDFSSAKDAYAVPLDTVYNGWNGVAALSWETHRLELRASEVFTHFVAFNGAPDATIAMEPVTHATDGFNLMARGVPNTGVRVLEPGETLSGEFSLFLEAV